MGQRAGVPCAAFATRTDVGSLLMVSTTSILSAQSGLINRSEVARSTRSCTFFCEGSDSGDTALLSVSDIFSRQLDSMLLLLAMLGKGPEQKQTCLFAEW